jgi:hypothetical protein
MNKKRAKEIFFQNSGQYYFMAHEGYWEEYKGYNIDKNTEEKWIEELTKINFVKYKKSSDMIPLIPLVEYFNKYELLDELLSIKIKGTYINKLVTIELLTKLLCKNKIKIINYKDKKAIIVNDFRKLIEEKIPVEYEGYRVEERIQKLKKRLRIK